MRKTVAWLLLLGAFVAVAGCGTKSNLVGVTNQVFATPPTPSSPTNTLLLLEWSYEHLGADQYRRLFTENFEFTFSALDSAGNAYRAVPWMREDELLSATHLFVGGGPMELPPAAGISLRLDSPANVSPDPRPGKHPNWHKVITTSTTLNVRVRRLPAYYVTGAEKFYFVRGDSAQIPADVGAGPDSAVWYLEAWEDLSIPGAVAARAASPARRASPAGTEAVQVLTWGELKVLYH